MQQLRDKMHGTLFTVLCLFHIKRNNCLKKQVERVMIIGYSLVNQVNN